MEVCQRVKSIWAIDPDEFQLLYCLPSSGNKFDCFRIILDCYMKRFVSLLLLEYFDWYFLFPHSCALLIGCIVMCFFYFRHPCLSNFVNFADGPFNPTAASVKANSRWHVRQNNWLRDRSLGTNKPFVL